MSVYPCCEHCHDHSSPWFGSETLTESGDGHTEPCQNCEPAKVELRIGGSAPGLYVDGERVQ